MGRAPDFPNVAVDMSTEVDALDPSIMDFALQGTGEGPGGGQSWDLGLWLSRGPQWGVLGWAELRTGAGCWHL